MTNSQYLLEIITNNKFPRGFATPVRCNAFNEYYIPNSIDELLGFIKQFDYTNCFLTVYSFTNYNQDVRDKDTAIIDVLPFDFDDEECPENALADVKKLLGWADRHNISCRLHYSGNKGFHVFIDIEPVKLNHGAQAIKKFVFDMQKAAGFKTLDMSVIGDFDRVIRIPNTINGKTGRYCIPLDITFLEFWTMKDIEYMARKPSSYVPERHPAGSEITDELHKCDEIIAEKIKQREEEERKLAMSGKNKLLPGLRPKVSCAAYKSVMENGVKIGARDHALIGIIHKSKKDGLTYDKTLRTLQEFGEKCKPPLKENYMEIRLKYHWKKDYSICTFFSRVCPECLECPHNKQLIN